LTNRGVVVRARYDGAAAEPWLRRAIDYYGGQFGAEHPATVRARAMLARAFYLQKRYREGAAEWERLLPFHEQHRGADDMDLAYTLGMLGRCYYQLDQPARALPLIERGLRIMEAQPADIADQPQIGHSYYYLARALAASGAPPAKVRDAAGRARAAFARAKDDAAIKVVDDFLLRH
jgi:tetratricopeptide (TPR) repeat protein